MITTTALCPLCKAPMIIQKGAKKTNLTQRYYTKKSHMYCSQCNRSAKEAIVFKLHGQPN